MLTHLEFSNFKSWQHADIELAPITLLFGPNSSGKSSILQFVLLLKQTREATDRSLALELGAPYVALGTFAELVHDHREDAEISWRLTWRPSRTLSLEDASAERSSRLVEKVDEITLRSEVAQERGAPVARALSYEVSGATFSLTRKTTTTRRNEHQLQARNAGSFRFQRQPGRAWDLPGPVKSYAFPDQVRTYFQNSSFLADLERAFEYEMDHVAYLGPLRQAPQREYTWARSRPGDIGVDGRRAVEAILAATANKETRNLGARKRRVNFQEMIAYWLRQLGLIQDFSMKEVGEDSGVWRAHLQVSASGTSVLLTDVGFGISQVLPVITLLYYAPEGSTILLEQPELHLHPRAQTELADLLISAATHRHLQIIVETHSEHLLQRLQRRVAEQMLEASKVRSYFCSIRNGRSELEALDLDLLGNITNWPPNFFGGPFGEVAFAERARALREAAE